MSNELNIANKINLGSDYFINKNISELISPYINSYNKNKTFGAFFIGIGIIIMTEVIKSTTLTFINEQKKEIRDGFIEILGCVKIIPTFKFIITSPYNFTMWSFNLFQNNLNKLFYKKKSNNNFSKEDIIKKLSSTVNLKYSQTFIFKLLEYIENNKNCHFNKFLDNEFEIDKNKIINDVVYNNICVNYENIEISIDNNIKKSLNKISCNFKENSIKEEINDLINKLLENNYDEWDNEFYYKKEILTISDSFTIYNSKNAFIKFNYIKSTFYIVNNIRDIIFTMCICGDRTIQLKTMCLAYCITATICDYLKKHNNSILLDKIIKEFKNNFEKNIEISSRPNLDYEPFGILSKTTKISSVDISNKLKLSKYKNVDDCVKEEKIKFEIKALNEKVNNIYDLKLKFKKFVKEINSLLINNEDNKEIKIYTLKVEKKIKTENKLNSEHERYIKNKTELLNENKDITKQQIIDLLGTEPQKELLEENIVKEVKMDLINEKNASFDNLYLSQHQDQQLYNLYSSFIQDKEKLKSLGISNKLCILLHGEPGTGKTTTIITTASYFGKDIFYISLKNISNDDLKMMFDFISEKHMNQGIIIFEDFDAMTNVVLKREKLKSTTLTEIIDNGDDYLTLEYFLNILDGTLTRDDSIIMMTTNCLDNIDPAIYREGRMDLKIKMQKSDHYQIKKIFKRFIERDIDEDILKKIEENMFTPAEIINRMRNCFKQKKLTDKEIMEQFL